MLAVTEEYQLPTENVSTIEQYRVTTFRVKCNNNLSNVIISGIIYFMLHVLLVSERYLQPFDKLTFQNPTKIVADNDENIFIVDHDKVLRLSKEGTVTVVAGMPTEHLTGGYRKRNPTGLADEHEFDHPLVGTMNLLLE
jgi:hypothetical protein